MNVLDILDRYTPMLARRSGEGPLVDVNYIDILGDTPLHKACIHNDLQSIKILIDAGADINAQGEDGFTPLHLAVLYNNVILCQELIDSGANPGTLNGFGQTPLDMAIIGNYSDIIALLSCLIHDRVP